MSAAIFRFARSPPFSGRVGAPIGWRRTVRLGDVSVHCRERCVVRRFKLRRWIIVFAQCGIRPGRGGFVSIAVSMRRAPIRTHAAISTTRRGLACASAPRGTPARWRKRRAPPPRGASDEAQTNARRRRKIWRPPSTRASPRSAVWTTWSSRRARSIRNRREATEQAPVYVSRIGPPVTCIRRRRGYATMPPAHRGGKARLWRA